MRKHGALREGESCVTWSEKKKNGGRTDRMNLLAPSKHTAPPLVYPMGDEEESSVPYSWTSAEPLVEGQEEAPTGPWVKAPGKCVFLFEWPSLPLS